MPFLIGITGRRTTSYLPFILKQIRAEKTQKLGQKNRPHQIRPDWETVPKIGPRKLDKELERGEERKNQLVPQHEGGR